MSEGEKGNFFQGLKSLFGAPAQPEPPKPPVAKPATKSASAQFVRSTAPLGATRTAPIEVAAPTPEERAEESRRRMGFIIAYMQNPNGSAEFKDMPRVYKIITDERSYQAELASAMQAQVQQLTLMAPGDPELMRRKRDLEAELQEIRNTLSQLFLLLKHITGVKGKTGGSDFFENLPREV